MKKELPSGGILFCCAWNRVQFFYAPEACCGGYPYREGEIQMETRIAVIGIVVELESSVEALNEILHEYREYIIGRMGIPYRQKKLSIISIAVDAPQDVISALSGKVGKLPGISSKTAYSGVKS